MEKCLSFSGQVESGGFTSYIFKPSKRLTDQVARVVKDLEKFGIKTNISDFYKYSVEKALHEYESSPQQFAEFWKLYQKLKDPDF